MARDVSTGLPTLLDVAKLAGVSPSTVSRVVTGKIPVSPSLAAIVEQAILETGYVPNLAARQLVTSQTDTIGLVVAQDHRGVFGEPFFGELMHGVIQALEETRFHVVLVLAQSAQDRIWLDHYIGSKHLDGIMLLAPSKSDLLPSILNRHGVPTVYLGKPFDAKPHVYIDADNISGTKSAVQYLYKKKARNIAFLGGVTTMRSSQDRLTGYKKGLVSVGLKINESIILNTDYSEMGGQLAMESLLKEKAKIDAVVTASDSIAIGAMRAVTAARMKIPGQISFIGFGDEPRSEFLEPALSTIAQHPVELGARLARTLVDIIEGRHTKKSTIVPTQLIIRKTT